MATPHPYHGQRASLATLHGKLGQIAPPLAAATGLIVESVAVDTDRLGTFSGELARVGSPMETAVQKARMGMAALGVPIGLASEGSIGPDPQLPFFCRDHEWVVLVDDSRGIVVAEQSHSFGVPALRGVFEPGAIPADWLAEAGFPSHGLIVRPEDRRDAGILKGIHDMLALQAALRAAAGQSSTGRAVVESDLRAHASPSRQQVIAEAAARLANRLGKLCPACGTPGWGEVSAITGLPCGDCGAWIERARKGLRFGCPACPHTAEELDPHAHADPAYCPHCNP